MQHKIYIANLNHYSTGFGLALIVFTVSSPPAIPRVGAFHDPTYPHGRKTGAALWTGRDLEMPRGAMGGQPVVERVIVVLGIPKDRLDTRKSRGRHQCKDLHSRPAIIKTSARDEDRDKEPQRVHDDMALTALEFLAPVIAALRAANLGGFDRLTIDADRTRRGLPARGHAGLLA